MKTLSSRRLFRVSIPVLIGVLILFSCSKFFKPEPVPVQSSAQAGSVISSAGMGKYFILHSADQHYAMNGLQVDPQSQSMTFYPDTLPPDHRLYANDKKKKYKYYSGDEAVLSEAHIYLKEPVNLQRNVQCTIPLSGIEKMELIKHDKKRTNTKNIIIVAATVTVVAVLAGAAYAATSCPYVSTYDGEGYTTQGEMYGGAIYPSLERDDFLSLRMQPVDDKLVLKLSNELPEKQYINYAHLVVATHDPGKRAIMDATGRVRLVGNVTTPTTAMLNNRLNQLDALSTADGLACSFNDTAIAQPSQELILRFRKPAGAADAKLYLSLKNSYWFGYMYENFTSMFGDGYAEWVKKQHETPASELRSWMDKQYFPLVVSQHTQVGWKEAARLQNIGPLANRGVVITLDPAYSVNGFLEVKINTGFMFWDIDFAGMDFSADGPLDITTLRPIAAADEHGRDVLPQIAERDDRYNEQAEQGNHTVITYASPTPPAGGKVVSYMLNSSGYYRPIRAYSGKADIAYLQKFREPGYFSTYSRLSYQEAVNKYFMAAK